jgi:hypothetical protein
MRHAGIGSQEIAGAPNGGQMTEGNLASNAAEILPCPAMAWLCEAATRAPVFEMPGYFGYIRGRRAGAFAS